MSHFEETIENIRSTNSVKVFEKVNYIGKSIHRKNLCISYIQPTSKVQGSFRIKDEDFTFLPDNDNELIIEINVRHIVHHTIDRKNNLLYLLTKNYENRVLFYFDIENILKKDPHFNLYFLLPN